MDSDIENGRPNIRIEIENKSVELMDVDEKSEEEGEIRDAYPRNVNYSDANETEIRQSIFQKCLPTFEEFDRNKLQERAKRFALKPDEIKSFSRQDLDNLYKSLGISIENADQIRFDAIYMKSSSHMNINDVMTYFMEYAPMAIEWIDDESCNVVWEDRSLAARTLAQISQIVKGMPVRIASQHIDNFILDDDKECENSSLLNKNRHIELRGESPEKFDLSPSEIQVDISEINIPIPPGYWRLGKKLMNSFSVLVRFSMKIDKKPIQTIKCNTYLKNTMLNNFQQRGIFSRNKEISKVESEKNPWGVLAETWDEDLKFREREHYNISDQAKEKTDTSELRLRLTAKRRLGQKESPAETKETTFNVRKKTSDESEQENNGFQKKMPRMRMYADEEEEKIKRRKFLQTLKKQTEKLKETEIPNSDLRNILRVTNKKPALPHNQDSDLDLSRTLKNRTRQLVFTVAQESTLPRLKKRQIMDRLESRSEMGVRHVEDSKFYDNYREKHAKEVHEERTRHRSVSNKRERISDRRYVRGMYSNRDRENTNDVQKTRSKVALVIKTQKKPTVASTIQSRSRKFDSSTSDEDSSSEESESSDDSESSSSSSSEDSKSELNKRNTKGKLINKVPIKVEIKNDK